MYEHAKSMAIPNRWKSILLLLFYQRPPCGQNCDACGDDFMFINLRICVFVANSVWCKSYPFAWLTNVMIGKWWWHMHLWSPCVYDMSFMIYLIRMYAVHQLYDIVEWSTVLIPRIYRICRYTMHFLWFLIPSINLLDKNAAPFKASPDLSKASCSESFLNLEATWTNSTVIPNCRTSKSDSTIQHPEKNGTFDKRVMLVRATLLSSSVLLQHLPRRLRQSLWVVWAA